MSENSGDGFGPVIVRFPDGALIPGNHGSKGARRAVSSLLGASRGVLPKFVHMPCKSGRPAGVRGGVAFFHATAFAIPAGDCAVSRTAAVRAATATIATEASLPE